MLAPVLTALAMSVANTPCAALATWMTLVSTSEMLVLDVALLIVVETILFVPTIKLETLDTSFEIVVNDAVLEVSEIAALVITVPRALALPSKVVPDTAGSAAFTSAFAKEVKSALEVLAVLAPVAVLISAAA